MLLNATIEVNGGTGLGWPDHCRPVPRELRNFQGNFITEPEWSSAL
ncbi:hypothetical protein [Azospirillum doebereinerae]